MKVKSKGAFISRYTGVNVSKTPFYSPGDKSSQVCTGLGAKVWGDFVRLNQCQPACSAMGLHSGGVDQGTLNAERLLSETELTAGRWAVFRSTGILFSPLPPRIFLLRCRVPV